MSIAESPSRRSPEFREILLKKSSGVAHIVLNAPGKLNVLGLGEGSNRDEIVRALADADRDPEIGCILIRANGKAFCAGGDLTKLKRRKTTLDNLEFGRAVEDFHENIRKTRKPVIAAVHGLCLGAGLAFIGQCDIVIAADDARFGLVEGRIGLPGAAAIVPKVGPAWAKYLIWTGEMIDANRAERIGLALMVLPKETLLQRATNMGERIARMPAEGVQLNKLSIDSVATAAGLGLARLVGQTQETVTRSMSAHAKAPDGRAFEDILETEGMSGLKRARDAQFSTPWLGKE